MEFPLPGSLRVGRALPPEFFRSPAGDSAAIIIMVWRGQAPGRAIYGAPGNALLTGTIGPLWAAYLGKFSSANSACEVCGAPVLMGVFGETGCCFEGRWALWALDVWSNPEQIAPCKLG